MAYTIISQNNTTTTLSDENGNIITVPARVTLATSTDYTITKVNNNSVDLVDGSGKVIRGVPACVVLAGEGGGGSGDSHNKGYYATPQALAEAYPTATAGDFAIVGSTDTVWLWDTDTSAWKDSDTKGQVTSVNGQTGDVSLSIPDAVQYSTMPTASADNLGDIVQFTGTTDANYTNGYFYKCVSDGQEPATYSWSEVQLGGSSYTAGSGIDITNDVISVTSPVLVNKARTPQYGGIVIGQQTSAVNTTGIAIGRHATATTYAGQIVIGEESGATDAWGVAIGYNAHSTAEGAIQLSGAGNTYASAATNSERYTFKVCLGAATDGSKNYKLLNSDGTIPTARLTKVNTTATLAVADWSSNTQTITVSGVKADSVVFVSPAPASASDYASAGILCTAQAADSLTFTATTTPSVAIVVNIICL